MDKAKKFYENNINLVKEKIKDLDKKIELYNSVKYKFK